jgi:hypothetical protein
MHTLTFPPGYPIANKNMRANRMLIIKHGIVQTYLQDGGRGVLEVLSLLAFLVQKVQILTPEEVFETLNPGDHFGGNCLIGEITWRNQAGLPVSIEPLNL